MSDRKLPRALVRATQALLTLGVVLGALAVAHAWRAGQDRRRVVPGVILDGRPVGGRPVAALRREQEAAESRLLEQSVTLRWPGGSTVTTFNALGVEPASAALGLWKHLAEIGRSGDLFHRLVARAQARQGHYRFRSALILNPRRAVDALGRIKAQADRRAREARLDLVNRRILPGQAGYTLDLYASQERVLAAARQGRTEVPLAGKEMRPKLSASALAHLDISTVMGWFETPYSLSRRWRNRTYNLRVAARKLSGTILMPGEVFDFNAVLGPRTQQEGYRIAPVIARGELVDGIAGGVCQISSTLFAASFFAGLDILKAEVHSMPSHYIDLGLDATVVWPLTTMRLRNPYDFPVVIHYEVNSGRVRAEILGQKRIYRIGFERSIVGTRAYREEVRKDDKLPVGTRKVEQRGQRGYTVRRRRIFFDKDGAEVKSQYWTLVYPPTTMILRIGTKPIEHPDPSAPPPEPLKPVNPMPDPATFIRKIQ